MRHLEGNLQDPWGWVAEVLGIRVVTRKKTKTKTKEKEKREKKKKNYRFKVFPSLSLSLSFSLRSVSRFSRISTSQKKSRIITFFSIPGKKTGRKSNI